MERLCVLVAVIAGACLPACSSSESYDLSGSVDLSPASLSADTPRAWALTAQVPGEAIVETEYLGGGAWLDVSGDAVGMLAIDLVDLDSPSPSEVFDEELEPGLSTSISWGPDLSSCAVGSDCVRSFVLTLTADVDVTLTELVFGLRVIDSNRSPGDEPPGGIQIEASEQ